MTYSLVARDETTGQLGVAVQSHFFAVGSIVTWAQAGVGAVATQSFAEVAYGPRLLERLGQGAPPQQALQELVAEDPQREFRQIGVIDIEGRGASHTGRSCVTFAAHLVDDNVAAQANMMAKPGVCEAMLEAFARTDGDLPHRLLAALDAAERAGGDIRGRQSAALLVVDGRRSANPWEGRLVDVRVDDHPEPLEELRRLVGYSRAYGRLGEALFQPGSMIGRYALSEEQLEDSLERLRDAQQTLAPNPEATFWEGALLARAGRPEAARAAFDAAARIRPALAEFAQRLPRAGLIPAQMGSEPAGAQSQERGGE